MQEISVRNHSTKILEINAGLNVETFNNYYNRIKLLATVLYEWEGLPNGIAKRFIENNLFHYGKLAFFKDPKYGFMITKCNPNDQLNVYDEPIAYHCYGINYSRTVAADDVVIIRNNILELPTSQLVKLFCERLSDIQRTIDVNIYQQKMPKIIKTTESQRLNLKNLLMKVEGNEPYIVGNKSLDLDDIETYDTSSPYVADKLYTYKKELWSEMLDMLGINNANTGKRERLITDEVNSNNQLIQLQNETMLMTRKFACDEIYEKFGIDINVELRQGLNTVDLGEEVDHKEGGHE